MNCHIQDSACNIFLKGNYIHYTLFMIDKYGRDAVDKLEKKSKQTVKISTNQLKEMIDFYRGKLENLKKNT